MKGMISAGDGDFEEEMRTEVELGRVKGESEKQTVRETYRNRDTDTDRGRQTYRNRDTETQRQRHACRIICRDSFRVALHDIVLLCSVLYLLHCTQLVSSLL